MQNSRRSFLTALGAGAGMVLSGCVSDDIATDKNGSNSEQTTIPETTPRSQINTVSGSSANVLADEVVTIPEGNFVAYDFSTDSKLRIYYDIDVNNNVRIDLFVISTSGFVHYKRDQYIEPVATTEDTAGASGEFLIPKGNYYFVVDHTEKLEAEPPGQFESVSAEADIEITY